MVQEWQESYADLADALPVDAFEDQANCWAVILAGCFICIVGAICAIVLFIIPEGKCDVLGRISGLILIVGGVLYMIGWFWQIDLLRPDQAAYDLLSDEAKQQLDASLTATFGEALLAGGSAILLGLD